MEFFEELKMSGNANLYKSYITFNKTLLPFLNDCYRVRIASSKDDNKIYIFKVDKDLAESGEINPESLLKVTVTKTYARICNSSLIRFLDRQFNFDTPEKGFIRYDANFDEEKDALSIDMKSGVLK